MTEREFRGFHARNAADFENFARVMTRRNEVVASGSAHTRALSRFIQGSNNTCRTFWRERDGMISMRCVAARRGGILRRELMIDAQPRSGDVLAAQHGAKRNVGFAIMLKFLSPERAILSAGFTTLIQCVQTIGNHWTPPRYFSCEHSQTRRLLCFSTYV